MYKGPFEYRYIEGDRNIDPRPFKVFDTSKVTEIASCFSQKDAELVADLMNRGSMASGLKVLSPEEYQKAFNNTQKASEVIEGIEKLLSAKRE